MDAWSGGSVAAALLGIWATFALDVYSTLNSSPQTTEIFADDREDSLMHWVVIGAGVAVGGGALASMKARNIWPLLATSIVAAGMFYAYKHAVKRGKGIAPPANAES